MRKPFLMIVVMLLFLFPASSSLADPKEMAIIAGKNFPKDRLNLEQVRQIYLGDIQILESIRVYPVDQSHLQPIRDRFLAKVLNMSRDNYLDYWNKRLYRKGGITPLLEDTSQGVLSAVMEREGAIGYVWADEIAENGDLKILLSIEIQ